MAENELEIKLTKNEVEFVVKLLNQLNISPASQDAFAIVSMVQSLLSKCLAVTQNQ